MMQVLLVACLQFQPTWEPGCDRIIALRYTDYKTCVEDLAQWKQQTKIRWVGCVWERVRES